MRSTVAIRRIAAFEKRFGQAHLYLAYHAAFPLALTPDLLYRLWANFQQDIHGELLNIPWEAVADLLLSSLCDEVGEELYEMDNAVRNELLQRLKADERFCDLNSKQDRILQLSDFLLEYVDSQLHSEDIDLRDFAHAQHWTALAYAKPSKVVEEIAQAFSQLPATTSELHSSDKTEIIRLASLVETFAEPLAEAQLEPLLVYTRGMASFTRGDLEGATAQLSQITEGGKLEIAGQQLLIPEQIKANLEQPILEMGKDFSGQKLRGRSFQGQDLAGANFSYADLRGANFTDARLVGANFSHAKTGLQRRWAFVLMFCCFLLLIVSTTAASLIGTGWLGLIGYPISTSENTTFIPTLVIVLLIVFAVIAIFNIRQHWQSLLQRCLMLTLLFSPIAVAIAILIGFITGNSSLPSNFSSYGVFSIIYVLHLIGVSLCSFWMIRKGLGKLGIAATLGFVGSAFLTLGVGFGVAVGERWLTRLSSFAFIILGIVISLGFAFAYLYRNYWLISQQKVTKAIYQRFPWLIAMMIAIALIVSQFLAPFYITMILAISATAFIWALTLVYETARPRTTTARMLGLALLFTGVVAIVILLITFIGTANTATATEQGLILAIALPMSLIIAMFLILAGAANLLGAIAGIISVTLVVGAFFILAWINTIANWSFNDFLSMILGLDLLILSVAGTLATAVIIAVTITMIWIESRNQTIALIWGIALTLIVLVLTVNTLYLSNPPDLVIAVTVGTALATIQLGVEMARQAMTGNSKFISVRSIALVFASAGGTNFGNADLTNANFSQATLKCANFRQAKLKGTRWFQAHQLEFASSRDNYLEYPVIQDLLISGNGKHQNFDNLDLRGINLRGANLADASFVNTDLSEANLHDAHLSGAKLINTRLSGTNFTLAKMNGAYIQNCELTPETNLTGVDCDYIYTRLPTQDNPDPYRQPRVDGRRFKPGELNQLLLSFSTQGTPQGELHNVDTMQRTQQNFKK